MRTKEDFKRLNFNEYAFFKGCTATDAKWVFTEFIFPKEWENEKDQNGESNIDNYLTKSGSPKIKATDLVNYEKLDFSMRSNSQLEGECQLQYLCDYYNTGIQSHKMGEYSDNATFKKALKFTGKYAVLNEIMNPEQLDKLQKTWLLKNCYMVSNWSDNAIEFIKSNDWAKPYLILNLFAEENIKEQIKKYDIRKNPDKVEEKGYAFQNV